MNDKILTAMEQAWETLIGEGKKLAFKKGQVLFYEGHEPYGVFVLEKGAVIYNRKNENGDDIVLSCEDDSHDKICREHLVQSLSKGRVLGLGPFLKDQPFCCTCQANDDCEVIFISKTQLASLG
jgi:CRP-like cAMP-binding protein